MADLSENLDLSAAEDEQDASDGSTWNLDAANDFFDDEALEASDSELGDSELHSFPQFLRLPIELRQRVWEFFCPDLAARSRCFEFIYWFDSPLASFFPQEGPAILSQYGPVRAALLTHHESRAMTLRILPDRLVLTESGRSILRFNKNKDIVSLLLRCRPMEPPEPGRTFTGLPGFADVIQNLAIEPVDFENFFPSEPFFIPRCIASFQNLERLYTRCDWRNTSRKHIRWCAADSINRYYLHITEESEAGIPYGLGFMYCWPDAERTPKAVRSSIPFEKLGIEENDLGNIAAMGRLSLRNSVPLGLTEEDLSRLERLERWPLVAFEPPEGVLDFDELTWPGPDDGQVETGSDSPSSSGFESEVGEYESEGIDDSELHGEGDASSEEEEDDLEVLPLSPSQDSSTLGGSEQSGADTTHGDLPAAQFSSPEPEASASGSENSPSSSGVVVSAARRQRPTRRVVDTDSEGGSDEETIEARPAKGRRARAVLSESDSDSDDPGAQGADASRSKPAPNHRAVAEEDSESPSDGEDDAGDANTRPISLAERLQLHRQENPVSPSDSDDHSGADLSGGDYDTRNYADLETGDSEEELHGASSDGDKGGRVGNGLILDADEGSESDI